MAVERNNAAAVMHDHHLQPPTHAENGQISGEAISQELVFKGVPFRRGVSTTLECTQVVAAGQDDAVQSQLRHQGAYVVDAIGQGYRTHAVRDEQLRPSLIKAIPALAYIIVDINSLCKTNRKHMRCQCTIRICRLLQSISTHCAFSTRW